MSVPIFIVFESNSATKWIRALESRGYAVLYDSIHCRDHGWFTKNFINPHRMYIYDEGLLDFEVGDMDGEMFITPHLAISFHQGDQMDEKDWTCIFWWLHALMNEGTMEEGYERAEELLKKPNKQEQNMMEEEGGEEVTFDGFTGVLSRLPPQYTDTEGSYGFRQEYLEKRDTMLYQITRPGTLLPFTVVVERFKERGPQFLFTDIYASNDWDFNRRECRYDFTFLQKVWRWMNLEGEFTMDLVKERVRKCYPERLLEGEFVDSEPSVYRRTIENVIASLMNKDFGIQKIELPERITKKRRVQ